MMQNIGISLLIIILAYLLMRAIRKTIRNTFARRVGVHYRRAVYRSFQITISIVVLFFLFGVWGVNLAGLLAGAGFLGIVVGLAAQETLGNVISGMVMMFSQPFEVGDWIEVDEFSGIIVDISIIHTKISTFGGELVSIPNQVISSSPINNLSREGKLRIEKTIGIDYESDARKAKEIAEEELKEQELIVEEPAPKVMTKGLSNSSVDLELLFWIEKPEPNKRRKVVHEVINSVKKRFEEEGIGIPFPHRELIQHESRGWKLEKEE